MTDTQEAPDLRRLGDAAIPLKWVAALGIALFSAAVSAVTFTFTLSAYKTSVDDRLAAMHASVDSTTKDVKALNDEDRRQLRVLQRIDLTLARIEIIACGDPARAAACDRLPKGAATDATVQP